MIAFEEADFEKADFETGMSRLLELADYLEKKNAEYPINNYFEGYCQVQYNHPCGTPACAWGHYSDMRNNEMWLCLGSRGIAEPEFCITEAESLELFASDGCGNAKTALEAAIYIRKFVGRKRSEARPGTLMNEPIGDGKVEHWLQVWENIRVDNPNLRTDNKPLAVAATFALLQRDLASFQEALWEANDALIAAGRPVIHLKRPTSPAAQPSPQPDPRRERIATAVLPE